MAYYNGKKVISLIHFDGRTAKKTFSGSGKSTIVTNLTNTKWTLNRTIGEPSINGEYWAPFKDAVGNFYNTIYIDTMSHYEIAYFGGQGQVIAYRNISWQQPYYREIEFIGGGEDETNTELIQWLLKNATQIFD